MQLAEDENWDKLMELDELTRELKAGRVLVGFTSLAPSFPPTFKRYRGKGIKAYYHCRRHPLRPASVSAGLNRRYSLQLGGGKEPPVRSLIVHGMGQSMRRVLHSTSIPHINLRRSRPSALANESDAKEALSLSSNPEPEQSLTPSTLHEGDKHLDEERYPDVVRRECDIEIMLDDACGASSAQSEQPILSISKESNEASAVDTHDYSGKYCT